MSLFRRCFSNIFSWKNHLPGFYISRTLVKGWLKIFEDLHTILQRFLKDGCCFFIVKLKKAQNLFKILVKIFEGLQSVKIVVFIIDSIYKIFQRLCKDICNFFIKMNKLNNLFSFCTHVNAYQKPLDLSAITLSLGLCI